MRLLAAVAATAVALASPAGAAYRDRPQILDPKGDVRGGAAELDIVSARWRTSGTGESKALVATLTLAAPPMEDLPYVYEMSSEVEGCGTVWFRFAPGTVASAGRSSNLWTQCGGAQDMGQTYGGGVTLTLSGNALTWTVPIDLLPFGVGVRFFELSAHADVGEPLTGASFQAALDQSFDNAFGDGTWRMR